MSVARTAKVAALITLASTAVGALAGVATAALLALIFAGPSALLEAEPYAFAGAVGAACGAVLGPAGAFGLMRRVPLGRLFAETTAGAIVGGIGGVLLGLGLVGIVGAAAVGFTAAAGRLSWSYRRARRLESGPPAG